MQATLAGLLALLLFIAGSWHQDIIGFDSRFVVFAQEMLRHGPGFFPTTYGEPYADYSAFTTLLIYLCSLPLGQVTSFSAWLPTAIASAVLVGLMYRLVAPYSRQWALLSIGMLLLTNTFITETRAVSLDQMLATVTFAVFYLGYAHDQFQAPRRMGWVFALLVLGFAIRGPIGLVVPTGVLCSYYLISGCLMQGQWQRPLRFGLLALLTLLLCIASLLALAWISGGDSFMAEVVRMQFTSRMDGSEGSSPALWYFNSSMGNYALAYPLAIVVLLVVGATAVGRQPRTPALTLVGLCLAAALTVMLGLSVPQAKKARYLLPMLPMVAIIAAYPFKVTGQRWARVLRTFMLGVFCVIPGVLLAALLMARPRFPEELGTIGPVLVVLGLLQMGAIALLVRPRLRTLGLTLCAVLAVWGCYIGLFEKVERNLYDTEHFSQAVFGILRADPLPLVLHGMGKDAKAIKFMVNVDTDLRPQFTQTAPQLQAIHAPAYVAMSNTDYLALQGTAQGALPVIYSGRFDKEDYVLLRLPGVAAGGP
ncbi:ArnT family glycosyltransferase [Pseudomonas huanghezhanensis]|uniref:ArnT family glycosyltransferase n=1 Tax=Pseudomonas huanghezhanensis TaxID=3002903 RepID=UPI0022854CDB|nr:phospholipid carrier-dependent glycosyltransferase [Pseudomonas sp. BSw22131]